MYLETYAKKYTNVLYGTEKHRDLCKKNYRDVLYGTDDNVETYAKKITQMFHMGRTPTQRLMQKNSGLRSVWGPKGIIGGRLYEV